jgi:hypothetical protein
MRTTYPAACGGLLIIVAALTPPCIGVMPNKFGFDYSGGVPAAFYRG